LNKEFVSSLDVFISNIPHFAILKDNDSNKNDKRYLLPAAGLMDNECDADRCPIFGVRNGGPIIGLGILLILFGIIPIIIGSIPLPVPVALLFIGFGGFLIWVGLTQ